MTAAERIEMAGYDAVRILKSHSYDDALIGVTEDERAVYDYRKMITCLMEHDGMTEEDAVDFISFDTATLLKSAGPDAPIIMYPLD